MFEKIKSFIRKVGAFMFPRKTLVQIIGEEIALTDTMIKRINLWDSMMHGKAPWVKDSVKSIGLEQAIVAEFANVCLSEMETSVSNPKLDELYQSAIANLNEQLQDGLGLGSMCLKALEDGTVEFVSGNQFVPIRFGGKKLTHVVFMENKQIDENSWYVRLEYHLFDGGTLTIRNKAYKTNSLTSFGIEIPLSKVPDWADLSEEIVYTGVEKPDFGYFRCPRINKVDDSDCGVSVFESAIEQIKDADEQYAGLKWEFKSGERAVHVDESILRFDEATNALEADQLDKRLYRGLNARQGTDKDLIDVFSPEFREQSILNGFNAYLRRVEFNTRLAYGDISEVAEIVKTATEVLHSKERKFHAANAIETALKDCLEGLVYAIAFYADMTKSGYEFLCEFKDSILTDDESESQSMREDVAAGIIDKVHYIMKKYNVSEADAKKMMPKAEPPPKAPDNQFGIE